MMNTEALEGALLYYWTAVVIGLEKPSITDGECFYVHHHVRNDAGWYTEFNPLKDWSQVELLMEYPKNIVSYCCLNNLHTFSFTRMASVGEGCGLTFVEALCRALVASAYGERHDYTRGFNGVNKL